MKLRVVWKLALLLFLIGLLAGGTSLLLGLHHAGPALDGARAGGTRVGVAAGLCHNQRRYFQMGVVFPQWTPGGYGRRAGRWQTELPEMQAGTAACWVEMPVLFYQATLTSTVVGSGPGTPTVAAVSEGIRFAHHLGLHVFVTLLLRPGGPHPWAGAIHFESLEQEKAWFASYWRALKPYLLAAEAAGAEQFALGTEEDWLQVNAPDQLWNALIAQARAIFTGALTYDMNWSTQSAPPRAWLRNPALQAIGVSAYAPLSILPVRLDAARLPGSGPGLSNSAWTLWRGPLTGRS